MNTICKNSVIFILSLLLVSCGKYEILKNHPPYDGDELRIDGYYYLQREQYMEVIFLYRNGTILSTSFGTHNLEDTENAILSQNDDSYRYDHGDWGAFLITDKKIEYELRVWSPEFSGRRWHFSGDIESDTCFHITQKNRGIAVKVKLDNTYNFKQFSHKPDSLYEQIP